MENSDAEVKKGPQEEMIKLKKMKNSSDESPRQNSGED